MQDTVKLMLDKSGLALDLEVKDGSGYTPLLAACREYAKNVNSAAAESISLLLQKGADLHARTNTGSTCLHVYFDNIRTTIHGRIPRRKVLVTLIQDGHDINAVDGNGYTIEDTLYRCEAKCQGRPIYNGISRDALLAYKRDLWDAVLVQCGRSVVERGLYCRKEQWSNGYSRQDFEAIWSGLEHLCPYY